jgi:hypothetical protein
MTKFIGAPTNINDQHRQTIQTGQHKPNAEHIHIRYGIILEVTENNLVIVSLLNNDGKPDTKGTIAQGRALPLTTSLSTIHMLFGPLRKGLLCKVTWRGTVDPNQYSMIEIVGDEEHSFLKKEPQPTEVSVGPWKIFSGGMVV